MVAKTKYYHLDRTLDTKIIGNYPQMQNFVKGYDSDRLESCSKIARYYCARIPDKQLDFDGLELAKRAKLTDYTHAAYLSSVCGLLVSPGLFNYFKELHMVDYITYDAKIYQKNSNEVFATYKWIHYTKDYPGMIDYAKSYFYEDHPKPSYKRLHIKSFEEYKVTQERVQYMIDAKQLVLKKEIINQYDVLRIGVIKSETYVTETVKKQMEEKGFTGIEFKPADYLVVE